MCKQCDGYMETVRISTAREYLDLIRQIKELLHDGIMRLVKGNCPLDDIIPDKPWPDDVLDHTFQCTACAKTFRLGVDTYHGSGRWGPVAGN